MKITSKISLDYVALRAPWGLQVTNAKEGAFQPRWLERSYNVSVLQHSNRLLIKQPSL